MATCPECDADLDIEPTEIEEGDHVTCPDCGESFVVLATDPLELDLEDDDDEDEDEDELDDEDDEDDLEDEEDEEGWEE
jgi:alpha-aminoadipate/glutamate carrier protein LysW